MKRRFMLKTGQYAYTTDGRVIQIQGIIENGSCAFRIFCSSVSSDVALFLILLQILSFPLRIFL